jgi:hypothetical protein
MPTLIRTIPVVLAALCTLTGCQSPTSADDVVPYADTVTVAATPDPIAADASTGGRTYRVVRGNNQPDDILAYDWHAIFSASVQLNGQATDDDLDVDFPVRVTAATLTVKQASGGIITPPTGGDSEKFEFITLSASGNQLTGTDAPINLSFEVWYDLPSLRKEAVVQLAVSFVDDDGTTWAKSVDLRVAP